MSGASRFLTYTLWFNPDLLPSPFTASNTAKHERQCPRKLLAHEFAHERTMAVLQLLEQVECKKQEQMMGAGAGSNFLAKMNKSNALKKLS